MRIDMSFQMGLQFEIILKYDLYSILYNHIIISIPAWFHLYFIYQVLFLHPLIFTANIYLEMSAQVVVNSPCENLEFPTTGIIPNWKISATRHMNSIETWDWNQNFHVFAVSFRCHFRPCWFLLISYRLRTEIRLVRPCAHTHKERGSRAGKIFLYVFRILIRTYLLQDQQGTKISEIIQHTTRVA